MSLYLFENILQNISNTTVKVHSCIGQKQKSNGEIYTIPLNISLNLPNVTNTSSSLQENAAENTTDENTTDEDNTEYDTDSTCTDETPETVVEVHERWEVASDDSTGWRIASQPPEPVRENLISLMNIEADIVTVQQRQDHEELQEHARNAYLAEIALIRQECAKRKINEHKMIVRSRMSAINKFLHEGKPFVYQPCSVKTRIEAYVHQLIHSFTHISLNSSTKSIKLMAYAKFLSHPFIALTYKRQMRTLFEKAQKLYHVLQRFVIRVKSKRMKIAVNYDIITGEKLVIDTNVCAKNGGGGGRLGEPIYELVQQGRKYLFKERDLIKMIELAICHTTYNFFLNPLHPRNPFTNMNLSNCDLYNIWLKHTEKKEKRETSHLLNCLIKHDCNIEEFSIANEPYIRDLAIRNQIGNLSEDQIYRLILNMFMECSRTAKWNIDEDFPKKKMIELFNPCIYSYFIVHCDVDGSKKEYHRTFLKRVLVRCYELNKNFGRKMIQITKVGGFSEDRPLTFKKRTFFNDSFGRRENGECMMKQIYKNAKHGLCRL